MVHIEQLVMSILISNIVNHQFDMPNRVAINQAIARCQLVRMSKIKKFNKSCKTKLYLHNYIISYTIGQKNTIGSHLGLRTNNADGISTEEGYIDR